MDIQSDLVLDSQLDTQLRDGYIVHIHQELHKAAGRRAVQREEYWRPVSEIGSGGYGSVWLQKCVQGQRDIEVRAVKKISLQPLRNGKQMDVGRELEAIAKFSHAKYTHCFVKSYGWYRDEKALYITMEYLQYGDLARYLSRSPPFQEDVAGDITYQILEGLSYMHNHEFVHRDLKPENVLIQSYPPQPWWVKIGDFGISKRRVEDIAQSTLLQGTLGYIAPELYRLIPMGTLYAADMWSLGEVAFRLMTKQPVFAYMSLMIAYTVQDHAFPVEGLENINISHSAQNFVTSLMAPSPAKRLTAEAALKHPWMVPYLPSASQSSLPPLASTDSTVESITEEFASWNSISTSTPLSDDLPETLQPDTVNSAIVTLDAIKPETIKPETIKPETIKPDTVKSGYRPESTSVDNVGAPEETPTVGLYYVGEFQAHKRSLAAVAFSPDGTIIATASSDRTIKLWDAATGRQLRQLEGHTESVESVVFSPDGKIVVSGSHDKTMRTWDVTTGRHLRKLEGFMGGVYSVAFSPRGAIVAAGLRDRTIRTWDTTTGRQIRRFEGHKLWVYSVAFSPDGTAIASGSNDKTIKLWDAATGRLFRTFEGHTEAVYSVTFSPDGTVIASGSHDKTVRMWNAFTGRQLRELAGHTDTVFSVAFSPDGNTIASGSADVTVRIWDATTGRQLRALNGHQRTMRAVTFSPDGTIVASGSYDGMLRTWDVSTST